MVKLVSSYLISLKVAEPMKDVKWRLTVSIWVDNDKSFIFKDGAKLKKKKEKKKYLLTSSFGKILSTISH